MANIIINQGTQTTVKTDTVGGIEYPVFKLDRGAAGASSLFTGTLDAVTSVANMVKGTVTRLEGGTVGVVSAVTTGTVDTIGLLHADKWGTVITSGTSTLGTIKAAVAGSQIFITDITISVGSPSNVVIASGGTSTPILGTLFLNANGGAVENFRTPIYTVAGSALVYKQSADGPMTITASGYVD